MNSTLNSAYKGTTSKMLNSREDNQQHYMEQKEKKKDNMIQRYQKIYFLVKMVNFDKNECCISWKVAWYNCPHFEQKTTDNTVKG